MSEDDNFIHGESEEPNIDEPELKTLKWILISELLKQKNRKDTYEYAKGVLDFQYKLKQEAIKWVKYFDREIDEPYRLILKKFFNITEEDLL